MRGRRIIYGLLLCAAWTGARAQDPSFSMFYFNKLYLNPAYAGINRDLTVQATTRFQWTGVPSPNETKAFSADIACPANKLGFGLMAYDDYVGEGLFRHTTASFSLAAHIPSRFPGNFGMRALRGRKYILSAGLQYSIGKKSLNYDQLVFSDQLDPVLGNIFPSAATANNPGDVSKLIHDLSAGVIFRSEMNKHGSYLSLGMAVYHINRPLESILGLDTRIPIRYTVHAYSNFRVSGRYRNGIPTYLTVGANFDRQQYHQSLLAGGSFTFGKNTLVGVWYRSRQFFPSPGQVDALVFNGFVSTRSLTFGYSYDLTVSGYGVSRTYGSHEFSIAFRFDQVYLCKKKSRLGRADRRCFLIDQKHMAQNELINFLP